MALLLLAGYSGGLTELALETHMYAALMLGSVQAFDRQRFGCCGVLLGLTVLCRTDAVLLCGLLGSITWLERRAFPRRMVIGALGITLPWIVASTLYFGSPFPRTLEAKWNITPFTVYLSHYATYFASSRTTSRTSCCSTRANRERSSNA